MANTRVKTDQAIAEINALIKSFNELLKATGNTSQTTASNFKTIEGALRGLRTVSASTEAAFSRLTAAERALHAASLQTSVTLNKQKIELEKNARALDLMNKASGGLFNNFKNLMGAFGIGGAIAIFAQLTKSAFNLAIKFDSLSFSLKTITNDMFEVSMSQRFLRDITQSYGVELAATSERWIRFLAAAKQSGVTLKDTEQIFRSVTKASAVLGLTTDDLSSVYLALEQMMSKGKVTTEELRRQLGEKLPGAIGIMAAAVGVGVEQLDSMLKKGEILSADALPKFAEALEAAYGIEQIENVETLMAKTKGLTNAWETFVQSVVSGNGLIGRAFDIAGLGVQKLLRFITPQDKLDEVDLVDKTIEESKYMNERLKDQSIIKLNFDLAIGKKYEDIDKRISDNRIKLIKLRSAEDNAANKKLTKATEDQYNQDIKLKIEYNKKIKKINTESALLDLDASKKQMDIEKEKYDMAVAVRQSQDGLANRVARVASLGLPTPVNKNLKRLNADVTEALENLAVATARYEQNVKNAELSKNPAFAKDEDKKPARKPADYYLKDIKDLSNEERIQKLKAAKEINDALLAQDKVGYAERQNAALDNVSISLDIAEIQYKEDIDKAKDYYDNSLKDRAKAISKGQKIIGDNAKFEKDLADNLNDATSIALSKKNATKLEIENKYSEEFKKILNEIAEDNIKASDDIYYRQITAAKEEYNASKKTVKDKENLEKALTKIAIEQANARIEVQIKSAETMIATGKLTEMEVEALLKLIEKLKASMQTFDPGADLKSKAEKLVETFQLIGDASQAISDLGSNLLQRKIEDINAEINAEKDKYDSLIGLAKNNKDEQERLAKERDLKITELEKKRLKEQQKQAKLEKANALVQIAINTAIAISKVLAQTGIFGLAAWIPIAALGAVQATAVLAQPIPKYKDGLDRADKDHIGMINDGGRQEYIERDGEILTTTNKNAIVALKKNDKVHKSYDDMVSNSSFASNLLMSASLNNLSSNEIKTQKLEKIFENNLKNLNSEIKQGIKQGFNNVKINNIVKNDSGWAFYKNNTL